MGVPMVYVWKMHMTVRQFHMLMGMGVRLLTIPFELVLVLVMLVVTMPVFMV